MHQIREIRAAWRTAATPSRRIANHMPDARPLQLYYPSAVAVTFNFARDRSQHDPKWDRIRRFARDAQHRPLIVFQGTVLDHAATQQHLLDYLAHEVQPLYTKCGPRD